MAISTDSCVVALLGREGGARQQLRHALEDLGAQVAYEGDPFSANAGQILAEAPNVVIVNLEEGADEALEHLQPVFEHAGINVVFNDAEVSAHLQGWDLARWARHLSAKVLGHADTLPPFPVGAEPLPVYCHPRSEAEAPAAIEADSAEQNFAAAATDTSPDGLSDSSSDTLPDAEAPAAPVAESDFDLADFDAAVDGQDFQWDTASVPAPPSALESEPAPQAASGFEWDSPEHAPETEVTAPDDTAEEDFVAPVVSKFADPSWDQGEAPASDESVSIDPEMAALLAQFDALESSRSDAANATAPLEGLDFSARGGVEAPASASIPAAASAPLPERPAAAPSGDEKNRLERLLGAADALSLSALDETPVEAAPAKASESGFDFSIVGDLSLEPLESEEEPASASTAASPPEVARRSFAASEAAPDPLQVAMDLVDTPQAASLEAISTADALPHVVVLAASIGGPDALRTFLSGLPAKIPAAFLIVQHLESGYFDRLAQQLQKSSALPVRVAGHGQRLGVGEVAVIPASERVSLKADGELLFSPHVSTPRYTPCIDEVLRDVADRFGARATAIIFSGMAGDAVEGAVYLTTRGGEVWVQDPSSCVVSSMVDGVSARGVAEFTGSPRELANHCAAVLAV